MTPIQYKEPQDRNPDWFNHTSLKPTGVGSKARLKLISGKVGKDNYGKEAYIFQVLTEKGEEKTWTVEIIHHLGDAMAASDMQAGDVFTIEYMGEVMKTQHGMKSKYELMKEIVAEKEEATAEVTAEEVKEVFADDTPPPADDEPEVRIEDMDNF